MMHTDKDPAEPRLLSPIALRRIILWGIALIVLAYGVLYVLSYVKYQQTGYDVQHYQGKNYSYACVVGLLKQHNITQGSFIMQPFAQVDISQIATSQYNGGNLSACFSLSYG